MTPWCSIELFRGHKFLLSLQSKDSVLDSMYGRRSLGFKFKGTGSSPTSAPDQLCHLVYLL